MCISTRNHRGGEGAWLHGRPAAWSRRRTLSSSKPLISNEYPEVDFIINGGRVILTAKVRKHLSHLKLLDVSVCSFPLCWLMLSGMKTFHSRTGGGFYKAQRLRTQSKVMLAILLDLLFADDCALCASTKGWHAADGWLVPTCTRGIICWSSI